MKSDRVKTDDNTEVISIEEVNQERRLSSWEAEQIIGARLTSRRCKSNWLLPSRRSMDNAERTVSATTIDGETKW